MVDQAVIPAIKATIRANEIGNASPYVLGFAKLGKSGASFGFMQGDTNVSQLARDTLRGVLQAGGEAPDDVDRIMRALSTALPDGNPLSDDDLAAVNDALAGAGRPDVDAMDDQLFQVVLDGLDTCLAAAASVDGMSIDPLAQLYIAPWINMTGAPTLLNAWLKGAAIHGVPSPTPPSVAATDIQAYLQATNFFQAHPRNFTHYQSCVGVGGALLQQV